MLKISSICCTYVIRSPRSTILLNFGNKAPAKKLWSLSLSLRSVMCWFWIWLRGLIEAGIKSFGGIDWKEHRAAKNLDREMWGCLLAMMRFWRTKRGVCVSRFRCRNRCITSCIAGHSRWWTRTPAYSSRGSVLSLNYHLFLRYRTF